MRRHSEKAGREQVAAAARRRLELLGRELEQAGLPRVEDPRAETEDDRQAWEVGLPEPAVVAPVGRHLRRSTSPVIARAADWMGARVPETFRGRTGLGVGPAALVVVLVVLALGAAAVAFLRTGDRAGPAGVPARPVLGASPLVTGAPSGTPSPSAGAGGAAAAGNVTVDVAGKVRRPGVTTLPAGSRVIDALQRAGGARGRVDLSGLNLARVLVDGEQILVGPAAQPGGMAASAAAGAAPPSGALVNLNTATAEQLDTLPGVGPVTAGKILDWRAAHGAFSSVEELLEVDGIGEKTLADLAPLVTV